VITATIKPHMHGNFVKGYYAHLTFSECGDNTYMLTPDFPTLEEVRASARNWADEVFKDEIKFVEEV